MIDSKITFHGVNTLNLIFFSSSASKIDVQFIWILIKIRLGEIKCTFMTAYFRKRPKLIYGALLLCILTIRESDLSYIFQLYFLSKNAITTQARKSHSNNLISIIAICSTITELSSILFYGFLCSFYFIYLLFMYFLFLFINLFIYYKIYSFIINKIYYNKNC